MRNIKRIGLFSVLMLCACCFCGSQKGCIPSWVTFRHMEKELTIQGEAVSVRLESGYLKLYVSEEAVYQSPAEWLVTDFFVADIDHDDADEVLLHVWKPGSFDKYQPFWMEKEEQLGYSEHLFLYEWDTARTDRLDPKWMSSAMPVEGRHISTAEDGSIHIVSAHEETVWIWEGWGLVLLESSRSDDTNLLS